MRNNETQKRNSVARRAMSLLELLAALSILGVLAMIIIPRLSTGTQNAKATSCKVNQANIEVQAALWRRNHGKWPSSNLSDVGNDLKYFPDGLPKCPLGEEYRIDPATGRSIAHGH